MADTNVGRLFYDIVANDLTKAGTEAAKGNFAKMGIAIGIALTGVGTAIDMLTGKYDTLMGKLGGTSKTTGISADSLRDMALSMSTAKDSVEEVSNTMDALSKYGVTTEDQMMADTEAALKLATANNTTGDAIINTVIPALERYGLTADDIASKSDALTAVTHSTRYSINDVANIMNKAQPAVSELGLSFDETAVMIEAMGQKGIPARNAILLINSAARCKGQSGGLLCLIGHN